MMSQRVWNILGILTILAGFLFFSAMPEQFPTIPPDQRQKYIAGGVFFAGLLGVIVGTCFFPKVRPFTLRILGTYGAAGCLFILFEGIRQREFSQFPITLLFWLPGSIYLMLKGKMN